MFSLTWPASMQIYWNKRKRLHKKRVQLPEDCFRTPTWPPFHCFKTPIWPPLRHGKTLYTLCRVGSDETLVKSFFFRSERVGFLDNKVVTDKFQEDLAKREKKRRIARSNERVTKRDFRCLNAVLPSVKPVFRPKRHRCRLVFVKYPSCYHIDSRNRKILYL